RPVRPAPSVLRISQDRVAEKRFLNAADVATTPWAPVGSLEELAAAVDRIGLPAVLKTTRYGYDGKGQARLLARADLAAGFAALAPKPLIVEGMVDFAAELSVIVARGVDGTTVAFDTVENRHRNGILDVTLAPARIAPDTAEQAQMIARRIAAALDLVGLLAVELFVDRDGRVLANEIAPRPHNSGHWTIDACPASQFELHIRAIAGLPLPPATRHSDAVMKNLIGAADLALWPAVLATPGLIPHLYGKAEARPGRKMGHVTRLFPNGALPGEFGVAAALGPLAVRRD
ncbi:MAG TPA: 5-(carboxyamino)imidazole ribonucleotide synthase, partial [Acetobacteraceae bacterium]|nr:5-(carboxyamino)imidazole ribonucleotide synthase [Acetobacteraceae bacterium]